MPGADWCLLARYNGASYGVLALTFVLIIVNRICVRPTRTAVTLPNDGSATVNVQLSLNPSMALGNFLTVLLAIAKIVGGILLLTAFSCPGCNVIVVYPYLAMFLGLLWLLVARRNSQVRERIERRAEALVDNDSKA